MIDWVFEIIRSVFLIIASILILVTSIGILKLNHKMENVNYVRIHILGIADIAAVLALFGLNQPLIAGIYFILAPILAHTLANAYYHGEDEKNYEKDMKTINFTETDNKSDDSAVSKIYKKVSDNESIEIKNVDIDDIRTNEKPINENTEISDSVLNDGEKR